MRKDFDLTSRKTVAITIGAMKDEESFFGLLGTIVATAIVGRIPSREDRASFMGTSETKLSKLVKNAIEFAYNNGDLKKWFGDYTVGCPSVNNAIYALATQVVAQGFYYGDNGEPLSRRAAREFLNKYFKPQAVQTASAFYGYQMVLEYFWYLMDRGHSIIEFKKFTILRFDDSPSKVQDFCDCIADFMSEKQETHERLTEKCKYSSVIQGLLLEAVAAGEIDGDPEI